MSIYFVNMYDSKITMWEINLYLNSINFTIFSNNILSYIYNLFPAK